MLEAFQNWTVTFTGGFALYALICVAFVSVVFIWSMLVTIFEFIND